MNSETGSFSEAHETFQKETRKHETFQKETKQFMHILLRKESLSPFSEVTKYLTLDNYWISLIIPIIIRTEVYVISRSWRLNRDLTQNEALI